MKRKRQSEPILINELPEDLVVNILACLPIEEAVRTSILSRKWRYTWKKLPKLVFDNNFCKRSIRVTRHKLIAVIYQVLLLHRGPLHEFTLSLCTLKSSCSEIDQFVLVVLQNGVKKLTLSLRRGQPYRLPSSIFAYVQQLVYLNLYNCVFKPPLEFKGFSKLENLVLVEVGFDDNSFSSLISHCPLLKSLSLKSSTNCGNLDIDSPSLEFLCFEGLCSSLFFKNTPKLKIVQISSSDNIKNDALGKMEAFEFMFCGNLPVVEEIILDNFYAKYMAANRPSRSLSCDLCHLKTLHLSSIWSFAAFCLVRNSRSVEKLTINVSKEIEAPSEDWFSTPGQIKKENKSFSDITLGHLRRVELRNLSGLLGEKLFIKHILDKSPVLKKLVIDTKYDLVGDEALRFLKQIMGFRRASAFVEIVYKGYRL